MSYGSGKTKELIEKVILKEFPDFKVICKNDSKLMRLISKVLFFNKKFMSHYVTTIGNTIYGPDLSFFEDDNRSFIVIAHEYVHMCDNKKYGFLYNLIYLSPQIFALLSLLSFFNLYWLFCLLFLLPLPSVGRTWLEYRGYSMSIACYYWLYKEQPPATRYLDNFTTSLYYWMCPFKSYISSKLEQSLKDVVNGKLTEQQTKVEALLNESRQQVFSKLSS